MKELGEIAYNGVLALQSKNYKLLCPLMERNFAIRRKLYGDLVVGLINISMINLAKENNLTGSFTGSGGAIVMINNTNNYEGTYFNEEQEQIIKNNFNKNGFHFERISIYPSIL